jgi:Flp pilus assembly protein TadB
MRAQQGDAPQATDGSAREFRIVGYISLFAALFILAGAQLHIWPLVFIAAAALLLAPLVEIRRIAHRRRQK